MGLWDKITGEFIDVVEWIDDTSDTMVYRFERYGNEIKYGARLTVRESQVAVFINEGQLADIFQPGMYTLETQNMPILSTLQGWAFGFQSPFKAEIYFVATRRFTGLKWGTKNPVMLRDAEFGPVRLRAFGTYAVRVADPALFLREIVGTDGRFTTAEIAEQLRNLIVSRFAGIIGNSGIPVLDLAASYDQLSRFVTERIRPEFLAYGLEILDMLVENISLPPKVEEALDRRTSMGIVGDLGRYTQFQTAEAIPQAAANPGGAAGAGIGMGMGFAMADRMARTMAADRTEPGRAAAEDQSPPPLPQPRRFHVAVDGRQTGPFDGAELRRQVEAGGLTRATLVWAPGMAAWAPAGEVPELAALFAAQPPPLPPGA